MSTMKMNNTDGLEKRIIICDPKNVISPQVPFLGDAGAFREKEIEYTIVSSMDLVVEKIRERPAPYYSLVIYESSQVTERGSAGKIGAVRKHDFFLPQMVMGDLKPAMAGQCARAGALYLAEDSKEARDQLNKIFRTSKKIQNLTVVKIGGSAFDFDRQVRDKPNIGLVCEILTRIHQDRLKHTPVRGGLKKEIKIDRMLLTAGAGQHGDIEKDNRAKYAHNERVVNYFPQAIAHALQANLDGLKQLLGSLGASIKTGAFYYINRSSTSQRIPLIGTAPHYIMARDGIPLQDSDTHTIALAEFYGAERVILIKRTDGIYNFDPYRGFKLDQKTGRCASYGDWKFEQEGNKRYEEVSIEEMLSGRKFSREGTGVDGKADGSTGHLMEDSALEYMKKCSHVKELAVVHIAPDEMYYEKNGVYKHVVTGDTRPLNTNWNVELGQRIKDAFQGKAVSKVVRDK